MVFMNRKITEYLKQWKSSLFRQPLILQGARQVGKTYAVLEFGKNEYANVAYFNFETNSSLAETFKKNIEPDYLLPLLSRISGQTIIEEKTLIFFDEVQRCERALTSLKYFCEQAPDYHVIAAGSLLGVAVNREENSFPVGKVDMKTMYPMDFEEFLLALDESELIGHIRKCFNENEAMPAVLHEAAMQYYREYLVVGGMPDCVSKFIQTHDYPLIRHTQDVILQGYLHDMSKYNTKTGIRKTRLVYDSVTVQLSKKNTRFMYKLVSKSGRAAEYEDAIDWLALAGIMIRVFCVDTAGKPLDDNKNIDAFKTFVSDVGLLCAKKNVVAEDVLYGNPALNDFKGGMTENYVCCQLTSAGYRCFYWMSEHEAEVDLVIQKDGEIIPIEVKSADNARAKSLNVYMKRYKPPYGIKASAGNFGFIDGKKTIPLYALFCL
jgi:predicted AAA+ superfamily ATPase